MKLLAGGDPGVATLVPRADGVGPAPLPLLPARRAWNLRLTDRLASARPRGRGGGQTVEEAEWKALPLTAMCGVVARPVDPA